MRYLKLSTITTLLLLTTPMVFADAEPSFNRASLNVSVSEEVRADTIIATLGVTLQGKDTSKLINEVNTRVGKALKELTKFNKIKAETLDYQTQAIYQNGRQSGLYDVSQSIRIESLDFDVFSKAIQKLQAVLDLQSVSYQLSATARTASTDRLTSDAIKRFSARANKITADFGFTDYRLVSINIGGAPRHNFRRQESRIEADMVMATAAPVFQAGEQAVSVSVNGTIEMLD